MNGGKSSHKRKQKSSKSGKQNSITNLCINRIRNNPGDVMAKFNLAHELKRQGDLTGALKWYDQGLKKCPNDVNALINRALILIYMCIFERAVVDLANAILIDPFQPKAYFYRAIAYWCSNKKAEAIEDLKYLKQFFPEITDLIAAFDFSMNPPIYFKAEEGNHLKSGTIDSSSEMTSLKDEINLLSDVFSGKEQILDRSEIKINSMNSTGFQNEAGLQEDEIHWKQGFSRLMDYLAKAKSWLRSAFNNAFLLLIIPLNEIMVENALVLEL